VTLVSEFLLAHLSHGRRAGDLGRDEPGRAAAAIGDLSFLVARRTTRRLDALAATAKALRKGDYTARVAVSGQDEVANLQADFNAMADELARTLADLQVQRDHGDAAAGSLAAK